MSTYEQGETVCCLFQNWWYKAKILNVKKTREDKDAYDIHYHGWNKRYDETILEDDAKERFRKYDEETSTPDILNAQNVSATTPATKKTPSTAKKTPATRKKTPSTTKKTPVVNKTPAADQTPVKRRQSARLVASSSKRARTAAVEEVTDKESSFAYDFPVELAVILVKDLDLIESEQKMPKLPARFTVEQIVYEYKTNAEKYDETQIKAINTKFNVLASPQIEWKEYCSLFSDGILDCFNVSLRSNLLYKVEWPEYDKLKTGADGDQQFVPSKYYGFLHLIRLCSKFEHIFEKLQLTEEIIATIQPQSKYFVKFLAEACEKYFNASEDYI